MKAYMTIDLGSSRVGTLDLILYKDTVPKTVANFCGLFQNFKGCSFHRIIPGFMAQGGDFTHKDGTGGESIYGKAFEDENFEHSHNARGILSMANSGPDTNQSQFFITFRPAPHLDGKHVVFGHVDLATSAAVLDVMEQVSTGKNDVPRVPVTISDCGITDEMKNEGEIDLDVKEKATEQPDDNEQSFQEESIAVVDEEIELPEEEDDDNDDNETPKTKSQLLKERLRKLKLKMNQARQLNQQEVLREGERLGSVEGIAKDRKRQAMHDKKLRQKEWEAHNAKALQVAAANNVDGKALVEPAIESIKRVARKEKKAEASRYAVNDYYNPEGQHRNYERNIQSLPSASIERSNTSSTFDPTMVVQEDAQDREGARRLANELKRRIEKKAKRKQNEFEATDVSYINKRNKRYNEKISRNYDQHTAEIRRSLERGTAL